MVGYIGSKAVTLSTTAADVAGNAVIDGDLTVKGTTVTIDSAAVQEIRLGDNDKMTFGDATGGDLQIYHDGSHSYIAEGGSGSGSLRIRGENLVLEDNSGNDYLNMVPGASGYTKLYQNGSEKLATTSTGIDVTGTVFSDNMQIEASTSDRGIYWKRSSDNWTNAEIRVEYNGNYGGTMVFGTSPTGALTTTNTDRLKISNNGDISFYEDTGTTAKFFWDASAERLGIGTSSPSEDLTIASTSPQIRFEDTDASGTPYSKVSGVLGNIYIQADDGNEIADSKIDFRVDGVQRAIIDSSGNLLVGKTDTSIATQGVFFGPNYSHITSTNDTPLALSRKSSDGIILDLRKDGTTVGSIGVVASNNLYVHGDNIGLGIGDDNLYATNASGASNDNAVDLGDPSVRWDDVYATNGTIQTSDQNEKQQIASLTDAEMTAAKAISKLFKTFKWNDSVAEKGDAARTHTGVIAQEVEQAMTDAGLNAGDYAFFISTTWWETQTEVPAVEAVEAVEATYDEEGNVLTEAVEAVEAREAYTRTDTYHTAEEAPEGATERNRKGIRYPQLLSFIGAATEQRLASIESRLDALEGN